MGGRLVVVGADAAGMSAAAQARRTDETLEVVAFERGRWSSYSACGIPYLVGGEVGEVADLQVRTPQQFRDKLRIDVRVRHEVMGLDLAAGSVEVRSHEHKRTFTIGFDRLMVATGASPARPDVPGVDLPFVCGVQTLDDAGWLLAQLTNPPSWAPEGITRVVVVGGGYIGLEMAEAFVRRGVAVTIVAASPEVMPSLDPDMARLITAALRSMGVDVRTGTAVTGFEPGAVGVDGASVPADLVVLGTGVAPNSGLAEAGGLALGPKRAVSVDRTQRTSHEAVWSAGDCADSLHRISGQRVHIALGTVANKQGRVAGTNVGGGYATFSGVLGTAVTKVCSLEVGRSGLTESEAAAAGFEAVAATVESTSQAGYLPDARPLAVKVVAERGSGRLLGAQIVGREHAAKRIDVFATAMTAGMACDEVAELDLGYAPPFGPVWDAVQLAARKAAARAGG